MFKRELKIISYLRFFMCMIVLQPTLLSAQQSFRIDNGWSFLKGDLGGIWEAVRPAVKGGSEDVPIWKNLNLPHCYNSSDAVDPEENYYQGPAWYKKYLTIDNPYKDGRTILHFEGVGQRADVYVYTTKVGTHVGGYDEWTVDITEAVDAFKKTDLFQKRFNGKVPISIRVDNSRDLEMIPSDLSDFNLYGGIYRHLNLRYNPNISIKQMHTTAQVDASGKEGTLGVRVQVNARSQSGKMTAEVMVFDKLGKQIVSRKMAFNSSETDLSFESIRIKKPLLWSPDFPNLYRVLTKISSLTDTFTEEHQIGFRHVEFIANGPFHLNGKRLLLRGTHRHEDHAGVGAAMTDEMIIKEMIMMKEMGVNFVRLAHYQQSRVVLNACDSLGIFVWEEIPWCRGGLGGEVYKEQARRMLRNMIGQHGNHTSIILWGLGNENDWPNDFPEFDKQKIRNFMKELHDLSHQLDPSRMTTIRRCDFCKDIVDVYSPSIWAGWYRGSYTDYKASSEEEMKKVKHFFHAEWGGDSHAGRHSENPDKTLSTIVRGQGTDERAGDASLYGGLARVSKDGDWSESYICNLIDWHLKEQENMPWLTGTAYWAFKDFSTPVRPQNPIPYVNQKGVVERDFKKKEAYYVFQSYWSEKPMVHIYGHSWPVRWGDVGEEKMIKVYSNAKEVELFVNGISYGIKKRNSQDFPAAGLRWMITLKEGKNQISAVAKSRGEVIADSITQIFQTKKWGDAKNLTLQEISSHDDVSMVEVTATDSQGTLCLDAKDIVSFSAIGEVKLLDNMGTSDGSRKIQLYNGRAMIKVIKKGHGIVSVSSPKMETVFLDLGK